MGELSVWTVTRARPSRRQAFGRLGNLSVADYGLPRALLSASGSGLWEHDPTARLRQWTVGRSVSADRAGVWHLSPGRLSGRRESVVFAFLLRLGCGPCGS